MNLVLYLNLIFFITKLLLSIITENPFQLHQAYTQTHNKGWILYTLQSTHKITFAFLARLCNF